MSKKPNFLFIMSDQLRLDRTGFGGNKIVQTPNLDQLAARSVQFNRAYCNSPSCGPSRASLTAGRMPSATGSWTNAISLDPESNTFVRVLRNSGYKTGLFGKSHLQDCIDRRPSKDGSNMLDLSKLGLVRRPPQGEGRAVERRWQQETDWDKWERHWLHKEGKVEMPEDYYGYDQVELTLNHDDRPGGHHYWWVKEQGGDPDTIGGLANTIDPFKPWDQVWKSNCPLEYYTTTYITDRATDMMSKAVENDEPFFITASFPDPHHPFGVPEPYYSMYDREAIPIPETFYNEHEDGMPQFKKMVSERGANKRGPFSFSPSLEQFKEATAAEYGSITLLDEGIGQLLAKLDELGIADNTVVIFCADHGELGGDHGLILKFASHHQGVIQVPFLIAAPGFDPSQTDSLACLLDIGQTVLDLAGEQPYIGMQGHSLRPVLQDGSAHVRDSVLVEEAYQADFIGLGKDHYMQSIVTDQHRLTIYFGSEMGELYDLENDPLETNNLFDDPQAAELKTQLMSKLIQEMIAHRDLSRYPV